ncbi:hypothetical protein [Hymenobacter pini]|uniref:hypothetical protein n=1 Tax=Hymenobacter pini TaxID=2880879 RepID=UPI001CF1E4F8|nr:hypothetical protein [Hymenobacter pini]MCA8829113.1 hypothetical protein [Hymenobacter pini]
MTNNDLQQASDWTRNYRNQNPGGVKGHCISAAILNDLLSQPGCVGVRAYYGLDDNGAPKLILVGYDSNDNDILSSTATAARGVMDEESSSLTSSSQIATALPPCPPCCSIDNPLNS